MQILFCASFPEWPATLGPTTKQWDLSGCCQPSRLDEALANVTEYMLERPTALQLLINVKYWSGSRQWSDPPETLKHLLVFSNPSTPPQADPSQASALGSGSGAWHCPGVTSPAYVLVGHLQASLAQQALHVLQVFCVATALCIDHSQTCSLSGLFACGRTYL